MRKQQNKKNISLMTLSFALSVCGLVFVCLIYLLKSSTQYYIFDKEGVRKEIVPLQSKRVKTKLLRQTQDFLLKGDSLSYNQKWQIVQSGLSYLPITFNSEELSFLSENKKEALNHSNCFNKISYNDLYCNDLNDTSPFADGFSSAPSDTLFEKDSLDTLKNIQSLSNNAKDNSDIEQALNFLRELDSAPMPEEACFFFSELSFPSNLPCYHNPWNRIVFFTPEQIILQGPYEAQLAQVFSPLSFLFFAFYLLCSFGGALPNIPFFYILTDSITLWLSFLDLLTAPVRILLNQITTQQIKSNRIFLWKNKVRSFLLPSSILNTKTSCLLN